MRIPHFHPNLRTRRDGRCGLRPSRPWWRLALAVQRPAEASRHHRGRGRCRCGLTACLAGWRKERNNRQYRCRAPVAMHLRVTPCARVAGGRLSYVVAAATVALQAEDAAAEERRMRRRTQP